MHVVLWDTRKFDVSKDFAGGFGVGQYPGHGGWRGRIIRRFFTRDRRPVTLLFAYLAAIFRRLGHSVQYVEDQTPDGADLYVFVPSLITLPLERQAIIQVLTRNPGARVVVVGPTTTIMPEAFNDLDVAVIKGEAEQLYWKLDDLLQLPGVPVHLGIIEDLDRLPFPDWSPFNPKTFHIGYDFWLYPTALVQASRGCIFKCSYCPYTLQDNAIRFRDPEAVVEEICYDVRHWDFRSFKFRDPLFGQNREQVHRLAELIGRLPRKIQFSVETRIELMSPEILRLLKSAGLTSITVGIESPDQTQLHHYRRSMESTDRQREFFAVCRNLGIRTVAGFMIGFPDDTEQSIRLVEGYAKWLNPTFANFNMVTPYPGTEFFQKNQHRIADWDYSRYSSYTPVLNYKYLKPDELTKLHAACFIHFYFRWNYLFSNAHLIWPMLQRFGGGVRSWACSSGDPDHPAQKSPISALEKMESQTSHQDTPHRYAI
jgi:anaerobic magnesium-protoporphyrin IX monomethyl ester cyclase